MQYKIKKGDCNDFSLFSTFVANYNGYETWIIKIYWYKEFNNHYLGIFKEEKFTFSDICHYFGKGWETFLEIVNEE